jgi:hypothetical protein
VRTLNDPCRGNHDGDHDGHDGSADATLSTGRYIGDGVYAIVDEYNA